MKSSDRNRLWGKAAFRCSMPNCRQWLGDEKETIGEEAHIVAKNERGPRGISALTKDERDSYMNCILLCSNCHTIIDKNPNKWTVEILHKIKDAHEKWVKGDLEISRIIEESGADSSVIKILKCLSNFKIIDTGLGKQQKDLLSRKQFALAIEHYQTNYLEIMETLAQKNLNSDKPYPLFILCAELILFPDKNEKYPIQNISNYKIRTKVGKHPLLVHADTSLEIQLPFLPLKNGYIHEIDFETKLPSVVKDYPSKVFNGSYYWVKPYGVRCIVSGIRVWDQMEFGVSAWYAPKDKSPYITAVYSVKDSENKEINQKQIVPKTKYDALLDEYKKLKKLIETT